MVVGFTATYAISAQHMMASYTRYNIMW